MKILFTGSSGPKAAAKVAAKLASEHEVVGLDLQSSPTTAHAADITSITDWQPYLDGVTAVVHFAALHAPHRTTHARADFLRLNVDATAMLVESAKRAGVKRFLLASTTSVYGRAMRSNTRAVWVTEALTPVAEDITTRPNSPQRRSVATRLRQTLSPLRCDFLVPFQSPCR